MKGRAYAQLLASTQANADSVKNRVDQWLAGRADRWQVEGSDPAVVFDGMRGFWSVTADVGFTTPGATDEFLVAVEGIWTNGPVANRVLPGSLVRIHDCGHEDADGNCAIRLETVKP